MNSKIVISCFLLLTLFISTFAQANHETVFVHTDRESYLAGETVWCKVYVLNGNGTSMLSKVAYIEILDLKSKSVAQVPVFLTNGKGSTYVHLSNSLQTSGYVLRSYTNWMKNYPQETYFQKTITVINPTQAYEKEEEKKEDLAISPSDTQQKRKEEFRETTIDHLKVDAHLPKLTYSCREEVSLAINTFLDAKPIRSNLSVSVFRIDSLDKYKNPTIVEYLEGKQESKLLERKSLHLPEYEGMIISGYLKSCVGEEPLPNQSIQIFTKSNSPLYYTTTTSLDGFFYFILEQPLPSLYLKLEKDSSCHSFEFNSNFSSHKITRGVEQLSFSESNLAAVESRYVHLQLEAVDFNKFREGQKEEHYSNLFTSDFIHYKLDDYIRFTSLEEIIREYVSELSIRKAGKELKLLNTKSNSYFESSPLILVDGEPLDDIELLWEISAEKIENIKLITSPYVIGDRVFQGIVGVFSYEKQPDAIIDKDYHSFKGFSNMYLPKSPDYFNVPVKNSNSPDFRNLLYWDPDVTTDDFGKVELSFFTSDAEGNYLVVIQGVDVEGNPGYKEVVFEVLRN